VAAGAAAARTVVPWRTGQGLGWDDRRCRQAERFRVASRRAVPAAPTHATDHAGGHLARRLRSRRRGHRSGVRTAPGAVAAAARCRGVAGVRVPAGQGGDVDGHVAAGGANPRQPDRTVRSAQAGDRRVAAPPDRPSPGRADRRSGRRDVVPRRSRHHRRAGARRADHSARSRARDDIDGPRVAVRTARAYSGRMGQGPGCGRLRGRPLPRRRRQGVAAHSADPARRTSDADRSAGARRVRGAVRLVRGAGDSARALRPRGVRGADRVPPGTVPHRQAADGRLDSVRRQSAHVPGRPARPARDEGRAAGDSEQRRHRSAGPGAGTATAARDHDRPRASGIGRRQPPAVARSDRLWALDRSAANR
jgi:hypothetical protein